MFSNSAVKLPNTIEDTIRPNWDRNQAAAKYMPTESAGDTPEGVNYDLDTDTLKLQTEIAKHCAKRLAEQQQKIRRKQKKSRNKELAKCKETYEGELHSLTAAHIQITGILSKDSKEAIPTIRQQKISRSAAMPQGKRQRTQLGEVGFTEAEPEDCRNCQRQQFEVLKLEKEKADLKVQLKHAEARYLKERMEKDDALTRLSAITPSRLRDNNPNITDLSDQNRPTKINEKYWELYEYQWTEAVETLEASGMPDVKAIQTLLDIFMQTFQQCKLLATEYFFEHVQQAIICPQMIAPSVVKEVLLPDQLKQQVKEFRKLHAPTVLPYIEQAVRQYITINCADTDAVRKYLKGCLEVCWLAVVQDPPLDIGLIQGVKFDTTMFRPYTERGQYYAFLVWPALRLHENGPLLSKGTAQGSNTTSQQSIIERLSAIAPSRLIDNNPNIMDLSDENRPTKISEKYSELYDNQWTEAVETLEASGMPHVKAIQTLLDIFMQTFQQCKLLATEDFFEHVQQAIICPQMIAPSVVKEVLLPDQLKQQVKEFRKLHAPTVLPYIEQAVRQYITINCADTDAVRKYLKGCLEVCWLAVVQDPPLDIGLIQGVKFDTTMFRPYTERGQYYAFLVWPALRLHENGPLLSKGTAQGSNTTSQQSIIERLSAIAPSRLIDNNPNIMDFSDQNRPTKISEKYSELYDNQWTEAVETLEASGMPDAKAIQTLLDIFMQTFQQCKLLATEDFFEHVQQAIICPQMIAPSVVKEVLLPDQLKQQVKEFRKRHAPKVIPYIEQAVRQYITINCADTDAVRKYLKGCLEVCWLAVVQDPPLDIGLIQGVKFDTTMFRPYTERCQYYAFLVWPALRLHENGPLLSKGIAQGSNTISQQSITGIDLRKQPPKARYRPAKQNVQATPDPRKQKPSMQVTVDPKKTYVVKGLSREHQSGGPRPFGSGDGPTSSNPRPCGTGQQSGNPRQQFGAAHQSRSPNNFGDPNQAGNGQPWRGGQSQREAEQRIVKSDQPNEGTYYNCDRQQPNPNQARPSQGRQSQGGRYSPRHGQHGNNQKTVYNKRTIAMEDANAGGNIGIGYPTYSKHTTTDL